MTRTPSPRSIRKVLDELEVPEAYYPPPAPKMGRPPIPYTQEVADEICERLESGEAILTICDDPRMPSWPTVCKWKRIYPDFATAYARSRENSAEGCENNALREAQTATDKDSAAAARVRMDAWKWAAAVRNPRTHGDRTTIAGDPDNPLVMQQQTATRAELIRRLDAMAIPTPLTIEGEVESPKEPKSG